MSGSLIDSNVLLDIATEDAIWFDWSQDALKRAVRRGLVYVNPLTYAELSTNYDTIEELDASLPSEIFLRAALPFPAGFLAAKAFLTYRQRGGEKRSPLPDFYIGAHAAVDGLTLVTRDARGYRTYFPHLVLDTPST